LIKKKRKKTASMKPVINQGSKLLIKCKVFT
jgi:hypothetical protein